MLTPEDAEVWGLEIDDEMAYLARREIFQSPDSFAWPSGSEEHLKLLKRIEVVKGDVTQMCAGNIGCNQLDQMKQVSPRERH